MGTVHVSDLLKHAARPEMAPDWPMQSVRRAGSPPLRFHGRALLSVGDMEGDHKSPALRLWQRKAGGFVIEHSDWIAEGPEGTAHRADTLDAVMTQLEERCAALDAEGTEDTSKGVDLFASVLRRSRRADWVREFRWTVGEALDAIDRMAERARGRKNGDMR